MIRSQEVLKTKTCFRGWRRVCLKKSDGSSKVQLKEGKGSAKYGGALSVKRASSWGDP